MSRSRRSSTTTLESTPKNVTHWTRSLAAHLGVSQDAVWRTWQAFGLQPHRQEKFKLSADPQFVEKVYDIRGLYLNPPERTVVLCIDDRLANPKLLRIRRQRTDLHKPFQPAWKRPRHPTEPVALSRREHRTTARTATPSRASALANGVQSDCVAHSAVASRIPAMPRKRGPRPSRDGSLAIRHLRDPRTRRSDARTADVAYAAGVSCAEHGARGTTRIRATGFSRRECRKARSMLSAAMRSGAVALRQRRHRRLQAKAAACRATGRGCRPTAESHMESSSATEPRDVRPESALRDIARAVDVPGWQEKRGSRWSSVVARESCREQGDRHPEFWRTGPAAASAHRPRSRGPSAVSTPHSRPLRGDRGWMETLAATAR